jgi:hypothetical protein
VCHGARLRGLLLPSDVRDDHRTVGPRLHLRTVILTNPYTLNKAEGLSDGVCNWA